MAEKIEKPTQNRLSVYQSAPENKDWIKFLTECEKISNEIDYSSQSRDATRKLSGSQTDEVREEINNKRKEKIKKLRWEAARQGRAVI